MLFQISRQLDELYLENIGLPIVFSWAEKVREFLDESRLTDPLPDEKNAKEKDSDLPLKPVEIATASAKIGQLLAGLHGKDNFAALDGYMMSKLTPLASDIVKECLPNGLQVPFPANTFGLMTTTGAKGTL